MDTIQLTFTTGLNTIQLIINIALITTFLLVSLYSDLQAQKERNIGVKTIYKILSASNFLLAVLSVFILILFK